jgi:hypothetical protein
MDSIQEQVSSLNLKVDALHQTIEQLGDKISNVLSESKTTADNSSVLAGSGFSLGRSYYQSRSRLGNSSMEHKDVLVDSAYPDSDSQSGDRVLAPEIQIQRLTAQLTAAYNRIAALEEQLLSQRIH